MITDLITNPIILPGFTTIIEGSNGGYQHGQMINSIAVVNCTGEELTVSDRFGMSYTLPTTSLNKHKPGIYATLSNTVKRHVKVNRNDVLNVDGKLNPIADSLTALPANNDFGSQSTRRDIDLVVTREELLSKGGAMYLLDIDLTVALASCSRFAPHPAADTHRVSPSEGDSFSIRMELIDNEGTIGPKYVNLTGEPMKLEPKTSSSKVSGLYISDPGAAKPGHSFMPTKVRLTPYTPEELEIKDKREGFLRLVFDTYEEAKSFGGPVAERERQLKLEIHELKATQQREANALDELKRKFALEQEERSRAEEIHKADLERQKRELEHRHQLASMDRKDYYDHRSYQRKDSSEWLKFAPLAVSLIVAVIPFFRRT